MTFYSLPIGIFNDFADEDMDRLLCGKTYSHFDGREVERMRCTRLKKHDGDHGWISDREFGEFKQKAARESERTSG